MNTKQNVCTNPGRTPGAINGLASQLNRHYRANRALALLALLSAVMLASCSGGSNDSTDLPPDIPGTVDLVDRAFYILPPGNFGGQLPY